MSAIVWLIAIFLIVISLIGIVLFKIKTDELKREFNVSVECPSTILEMKEDAFFDYILPKEERIGYMHCYCLEQYKTNLLEATKIDFSEFKDGKRNITSQSSAISNKDSQSQDSEGQTTY